MRVGYAPKSRRRSAAVFLVLMLWFSVGIATGQESPSVERGAYLFRAAGGCSCHTDVKNQGAFMAGGRPIATPFGTIYSTNITPDPKTGIGAWSDEDFLRAMTLGVGPSGVQYFSRLSLYVLHPDDQQGRAGPESLPLLDFSR